MGKRLLSQRSWLKHLLHRAVVMAFLAGGDVVTPREDQLARRFGELLQDTPIPMERRRGFSVKMSRRLREWVTWGIRYPDYRGAMRETFWERLFGWVKNASETSEGRELLAAAGLAGRHTQFTFSVIAETYRVLIEPATSDFHESARNAMTAELFRGTSDDVVRRRFRALQIAVRALVAGVGTTIVSTLAFNQNIFESLGLGAIAVGLAAATDVVSQGMGGITGQMRAVRRQAKSWLATLSLWLIDYVTSEGQAIQSGNLHGVDRLVYVLTRVTAQEAEIRPLPHQSEILEGLHLIKDNASQANDVELVTALLQVQGALLFDPEDLPDAIGRLISVVRVVPDTPGVHGIQRLSLDRASGKQEAVARNQLDRLPPGVEVQQQSEPASDGDTPSGRSQ